MPKRRFPAPAESISAELEITDVGFGGDGVGRVDGRVWFVPFVLPGERVLARSRQVKKDFVRADLVEVLEPSAARVNPACEYFGRCGGCRYQHADYPVQLELKHAQVVSLLGRIAGLPPEIVAPVVAAPEPLEYRNRITVHIAGGTVGFHRQDGTGLMDIERCEIAQPEVNEKLASFRAGKPFDGHRTLRAFRSPSGFRQTNEAVAELLRAAVVRQLDGGGELLLDAYCGSGFFAKALRDRFQKVIGIDWSEAAIEAALVDVGENEEYFQADVLPALQELLAPEPAGATILFDPPAEGLPREVVELFSSTFHPPLVYVSCNPSTFARDVARLSNYYRVASVTPFDMFPQTAEVELLGTLEPLAQ